MEASRKSRATLAAANSSLGGAKSREALSSVKKALDFSFQDVEGVLHLIRKKKGWPALPASILSTSKLASASFLTLAEQALLISFPRRYYEAEHRNWQSQCLSLYIVLINQDESKEYRKKKEIGGASDPKKQVILFEGERSLYYIQVGLLDVD
ncbi:hypothetical protein Goklo_007594, partial [Gossypium klotzschianum]|nr:hypothetical protein [Gossypium klotzschianum]